MRSKALPRFRGMLFFVAATGTLALSPFAAPKTAFAQNGRPACPDDGGWVTADVVALDQVFIYNRRGAFAPGMIYALERDVVADAAAPGGVRLRDDKRPRPLTLRVNAGDCLQINFTNLLSSPRVNQSTPGGPGPLDPAGDPAQPNWDNQPATRDASVHVIGMQLLGSIESDGSNVGRNSSSLATPGAEKTYYLYAEREGTHLMYSGGAQTGGEGDGGTIAYGLFGAVNVQPKGSEWYRSQLTRVEMDVATVSETYGGQPILDYDATYPLSHPRSGGQEGIPILKMYKDTNGDREIIHSDLTAIITGPNRGRMDPCDYPENTTLGDRCQSFREFTIIFHDDIKAVQAFAAFNDPVLQHTLHSVRDGFAINYGTGGIGSEIIANRLGLGPEGKCNECKYEEFFLTSWALGDPSMVTDVLVNVSDPQAGIVAEVALYPDDPSNVYHSYLNDHVKIRNLHAGPKEHHIFHLHAHQWNFTPDSDESAFLDSQAVGPGSSYTYDIAYNGGGNRNKTPGDAIFHCHFYPHFAQGMWALWRNHDVFEVGTPLDATGKPVWGPVHETRTLPDAEIVDGTPNPGVVPIPGLAMAPMPTADMPGYPFYIPGEAGHRPPKPPLDTEVDGGLPRHVALGGEAHFPPLNRLDFDKVNETLEVEFLPEEGTAEEIAAMDYHAQRTQPSYLQPTNGGTSATEALFTLNGLDPIAGAPFADPCVLDDGKPFTGKLYEYRAAGFRLEATYNKVGWKNPQHHMQALDEDVGDFMSGAKPPEPFFFRANSNSCINFYITNLFENVYEMDDFQVRTPTDVLGQHIHLVKFDVTSSDGGANGWNYEDGSLSPMEVTERIAAIRVFNECVADDPEHPYLGGDPRDGTQACPVAEEHPVFKNVPEIVARGLHLGAQTTIQRWYADKLLNNSGDDRTLRTVYTHDHFAPSTQQQAGYYAGLLIEPENSTWYDPVTKVEMGTREDGGPTSWQAVIELENGDAYREFMFSAQDFALSYEAGADNNLKPITTTGVDGSTVALMGVHDPAKAINPPAKKEIGLPFLLQTAPTCPGGVPRPCPEAISADDPGTFTVNYRNEPIPLRVRDPYTNTQAAGIAGDLSHAFRSDLGVDAYGNPIERADPLLNAEPSEWPYGAPLWGGAKKGDPFTPLFRTYEADKVQIRTLVGAHEEGHNFTVHGIRWLFEPDWVNSGYKNSQMYGISEHFEFEVPALQKVEDTSEFEDYLYLAGAAVDNVWNGMWGIMRAYRGLQPDLLALSTNPKGEGLPNVNPRDFRGVCPVNYDRRGRAINANRDPTYKRFNVVAVLASDLLGPDGLVYNSRAENGGPLTDPNAILYVRESDIEDTSDGGVQLKAGIAVEPLVLRANAGDCIDLTVVNRLPAAMPDNAGFSTMPMIVPDFQANQLAPSNHVGLHGQLVSYDMIDSDGANVGFNPVQTAAPGQEVSYRWYAGDVATCVDNGPVPECQGKQDGYRVAVPIEFGATALISSDPIKHSQKGAIGSLIVEPQGATWVEDGFAVDGKGNEYCATAPCSRVSATVTPESGEPFRDFALLFQDDLNLRCDNCGETGVISGAPAGSFADANAVPNLADSDDPEDSGQRALNYKTEPMWLRFGFDPDAPISGNGGTVNRTDMGMALSNALVGGDPETPIFTAEVGTPVRFRVVQSGGHARNHVFTLHGHGWQQVPWTDSSRKLGYNDKSEWKGDQEGIGPSSANNFLLTHGAGGKVGVTGDYLFRDFASFQFDGGLWGILRVCDAGTGANSGNKDCTDNGGTWGTGGDTDTGDTVGNQGRGKKAN